MFSCFFSSGFALFHYIFFLFLIQRECNPHKNPHPHPPLDLPITVPTLIEPTVMALKGSPSDCRVSRHILLGKSVLIDMKTFMKVTVAGQS